MTDPRCYPLIELDCQRISEMLSPVARGAEPAEVTRVEGGLANTIYRVRIGGVKSAYALRVYAAGRSAFEKERALLRRLRRELPVPEVLLADAGGARSEHPYLVYRWIEGITLNECRRRMPPAALQSLAEPLGRLLARVARLSFDDVATDASDESLSKIEALLSINEERLRRGRARERLGGPLADELLRRLKAMASVLVALDGTARLVHGDLGGRNVLVDGAGDGGWRITGLIDWEEAFSGSPLWDVGSLFRYARRYCETFRSRFERGYRDEGGVLPEDWWRIARLLDALRLVETLNDERELPVVFAECRELVEAVVRVIYER